MATAKASGATPATNDQSAERARIQAIITEKTAQLAKLQTQLSADKTKVSALLDAQLNSIEPTAVVSDPNNPPYLFKEVSREDAEGMLLSIAPGRPMDIVPYS